MQKVLIIIIYVTIHIYVAYVYQYTFVDSVKLKENRYCISYITFEREIKYMEYKT